GSAVVSFSGLEIDGQTDFLVTPGYHLLRMTATRPQSLEVDVKCPTILESKQLGSLEVGQTIFVRVLLDADRKGAWRQRLTANLPKYAGMAVWVGDAFLVLRSGMSARASLTFDSASRPRMADPETSSSLARRPHFVSFSPDTNNFGEG